MADVRSARVSLTMRFEQAWSEFFLGFVCAAVATGMRLIRQYGYDTEFYLFAARECGAEIDSVELEIQRRRFLLFRLKSDGCI